MNIFDEILDLHNVGDPIEGDGHMLESVEDEACDLLETADIYQGFNESGAAHLVRSWAEE